MDGTLSVLPDTMQPGLRLLENRVASLQSGIVANGAELGGLRHLFLELGHRVAGLESRNTAPSELAVLRDMLDVLRADVAGLRQGMDTIRAGMAALSDQVERLRDGQAIYLGGHEALTRLHNGLRIYVDTRDVGICSHLMLEGRWEPWIEDVLRAHTRPGMTFVDVGANFGFYTLMACQWVGPGGHVIGLEANPAIFHRLRKSVAVNGFEGRARLLNMAAFSRDCALRFEFLQEFSGGGGVCGTEDDAQWQRERVTVPAAPLDSLLADLPEVHVMKIDVEGAEPHVIAGAGALIGRSPSLALLLEFREDAVAAIAPPRDWLQGFVDSGFRLALAEPSGLQEMAAPEEVLAALGGRLGNLFLQRG